jgi:hypothetical protein
MHRSLAISQFHRQPPSMRVLKWIVVPFVCVHVVLASFSGYRAIVQVYSLDLRASGPTLRPGSTVTFDVASSGRVWVHVDVELRQGQRAETLAVHWIPTHTTPSYDPRTIRGHVELTLTPEQLARLEPGPAVVRATAHGRSQWLRTPPPVVRELGVNVER